MTDCRVVSGFYLVGLWDGSAQAHGDEGPKLHGFDQEDWEAKDHGQWMEEVSESANHVGGRKEPWDHTGEQTRHPNQQEDTEGLKESDQLSMLVLGRSILIFQPA